MTEAPLICVIDDDKSVREALPDLIKEFGYAVLAFSSAEEFLSSHCLVSAKCLVVDIAMAGMSGPDLQKELARQKREIPIIFVTAHGDENVGPRLVREGAIACLFKPFIDTDLRDALGSALNPA